MSKPEKRDPAIVEREAQDAFEAAGLDNEDVVYLHAKTGNVYRVMGWSVDANTLELNVLYTPEYSPLDLLIWHKPIGEFTGLVEVDGKLVRRYQPIEVEP